MTKKTFAVYSADDGSLTFYRRPMRPLRGMRFEGKRVTKVFKNIEQHRWTFDKDALNARTVVVADDGISVKRLSNWFHDFNNLVAADLEKLDATEVKLADGLFANCGNLKSVNLPSSGLPNAGELSTMFLDCKSLTDLDMTGYNLSGAVDLHWMFGNCESLKSIGASTWHVSHAEDMNAMFSGCRNLHEDLSGWTVPHWVLVTAFANNAPGVKEPDWDYQRENF